MILTAPPNYANGWIYDPYRKLYVQMTPTGSRDSSTIIWHWRPVHDKDGNPVYIDEVIVNLDGHGGGLSHASLPSTMPRMAVGKIYSGTNTDLQSAVDNPGSLAAFNAGHDMSCSLTQAQQANVDSYWLAIFGAAGTGAQPGALSIDNVTIAYATSYGAMSW